MNLIKSIFLVVFVLTISLFGPQIHAQRIWMPNLEVQEGNSSIELPMYLSVTDSLSSLQLSVLWDAEQLRLDTLIFPSHLANLNGHVLMYNVLSEQEMRAIIVNNSLESITDPFKPDSLLLTMHFQLTDKFTGAADIIFNPEFQTFFAHYDVYRVFPELQGGGISAPNNTTSLWSQANQSSIIRLFPNPVTTTFNLLTEDPGLKNTAYTLLDVMGRKVARGNLVNGQGEIPNSLPNGTYFLTLRAEKSQLTAKLIVKR